MIEIRQVESDSAGRVLTVKRKLICNVISLFSLAVFFGGLGLGLWGLIILDSRLVVAIGLISAGGLMVVTFFVYWSVDSSMGANPWLKRQLKHEIGRRPSVFVDARDLEALFVEIVPKANWGKTMFENASDIGLLVVDRGHREIRFEGDKQRFRLPVAAIMSCEIEPLISGNQAPLFFMVLQARHNNAIWEAPIRERLARGGLETRKRKRAERLCQAVWEMMWMG